MFSLNEGSGNGAGPANNTRGRRRARPQSSENSVHQPKAKRQRVPLNQETFTDPHVGQENYAVKAAQPTAVEAKQDGADATTQPKRELSFRAKKAKAGDRVNKGDGSVVLTSNSAFVVSKLPALPDRLRADAQSRQHGIVDPSTGYALSLTHTHAVVWPYSAPTPSPEAFVFTLPYPSKHASDPLPLGSLVSPSASVSEPGLVVVMPTSGKITYWESISSATTLDFIRQQRNGVEDSIPGMWSSETVTQIINAESAAGFVLSFSSGRMAYMNVRDAHGRPQISLQFLRTSFGGSSGGIFGSIRHAFSHSYMQSDIVAVRSERSSKLGERTVIAASSKGRLHAWSISRGGHNDLLTEFDAKDTIVANIMERDRLATKFPADSFKVIDFSFVPKGSDTKYSEMSQLRLESSSEDSQHLLLLTSLSDKNVCRYNLVELLLPQGASFKDSIPIGSIRPITSYSTPPDAHALLKPRLYLPRPTVVAFLVFERATVIASVARIPDTPDSQLMEDNHVLPATYEDVVDLRADPTLEIVGAGVEEPHMQGSEEVRSHKIKSKNPAVVILVRGAGTLRVTTTDIERFASEKPPTITAKSKLEQAVFFGIKDDNPLVFDVPRELPFSDRELGEAAVELSYEILASNSPHLTSLAAHLERSLQVRVRALEKLMTHLRSLKVDLNRSTRWILLWNAEKLHAARSIWQKHEKFIQERPDQSKKDLVAEIVEYIRNEEKSVPDAAKGELDRVRHWFIHDAFRTELLVAWAYEVIKYNSKAKLDESSLTRLIYEAIEINNDAITAAMEFRKRNLALYGLGGEKMDGGILHEGYSGLSMPWTCDRYIANNLKRLVELSSEWVHSHHCAESPLEKDQPLLEQIRELLPDITQVYLISLQELTRWALASDDPKQSALGQKFAQTYKTDCHDKIVLLALNSNYSAAYRIADEHRCLPALAHVLARETSGYLDKLDIAIVSQEDTKHLEDRLYAKETQLQVYLDKYGEPFAFPYYECMVNFRGVDSVLKTGGDRQYRTAFLRTRPELAKVSWINDVTSEDDIVHAADTLLNIGLRREQQVWSKKIELSLGKLARMAETSRPSSRASSAQEAAVNASLVDAGVEAIDKELSIIKIQDQLYSQIRPIVGTAIDEAAELTMAIETFSPAKIPKKYKILNEIFEDGIGRLLKHEALDPLTLIDLLTMVRLDVELKELIPNPFFLAIQVASNGLTGDDRERAERLIWRRCYLKEDWTQINNTALKNDQAVMEALSNSELFQVHCVLYWNQLSRDKKSFRRFMPSETLGVYTEKLDSRFEKFEQGYREKLLEAMVWEDGNLRKHIEKHRLDDWAKDTLKMAEDAVNHQYDVETAEGANSQTSPSKTRAVNGSVRNALR